MPINPCKSDGKSGSKYGSSGKCYTGKGGLAKAKKQDAAIAISKNKKGK